MLHFYWLALESDPPLSEMLLFERQRRFLHELPLTHQRKLRAAALANTLTPSPRGCLPIKSYHVQ